MSGTNENVVLTIPEDEEIGEIISDDNSPSFETFKFKAFHDKFVSPGTIVAVKIKPDNLLVGRVVSSHENNPHFTPDKVAVRHAMQIESDHPGENLSITVYRVYEVDIMQEVLKNNEGYVSRPPEMLPTSGLRVIIPKNEVINEVLGIMINVKDGLYLGNLATTISTESEMPVIINKEILQRHIFIGGTTGGGKSYATKVLAEEVHKHGIPIIFFDTQNEFVPLTKKLGGNVIVPGEDYFVKLSSLTESEVYELVPSIHHPLQLNLLAMSFIRLQEEKMEFTIEDLLNMISFVCKEQGAGEKTTEATLLKRTKSYLKDYKFLGSSFNWSERLKKNSIFDIDCHGVSRNQLQLILAATMRELQTLRKKELIPPYLLIIDEAHLFVPQDEDSACKQIIREGVRIGRHNGICLALITQSPMDIDKKAIRQCNTRLIFAMDADQLLSLQGVKADASENMLEKLPKSPTGTCILSGTYETIKHAIPLRIRPMETQDADGGKAPPIFTDIDKWV